MSHIRRPARLESLAPLMAFVEQCAQEHGFEGRRMNEIQLAAEEALVNIFNHAYPPEQIGDVHIHCSGGVDGSLLVEFRDTGVPFDFEDLKDPDLDASISGRKIGGLGVFLIKKMVDDLSYRRDGDENVLTFILHPDNTR